MNANNNELEKLTTLQDLIFRCKRRDGHNVAVSAFKETEVTSISFGELYELVEQIASGLFKRGIGKGDYILLYANNRPEWIIACLAIIRVGAIVVPIDIQCDEEALNAILNNIHPKVIFTVQENLSRLKKHDHVLPNQVFLLDAPEGELSWKNLLSNETISTPPLEPADIAVMFYTSGTTGIPKGVPLSHRNLVYQIDSLVQAGILKKTDRFLLPLPMHHIYPFVTGILLPLSQGCTIVLPYALTGPRLLQSIKEGRINIIVGVPRLYEALYKAIYDRVQSLKGTAAVMKPLFFLSEAIFKYTRLRLGKTILWPIHQEVGKDLRLITSGGASIKGELIRKLEGIGWQMAIGYGLSETSPLVSMLLPGDGNFFSVGKPLSGTNIRIEDDEIQVKGPGVFSGYLNLPAVTENSFTKDGWFRTGDTGFLKNGYLTVVGRLSSLIVVETGKKIDPEWLEECYQRDPFIKEIGILLRKGRLVAVILPDVAKIQAANLHSVDAAIHDAVDRGSLQLPTYKRLSGYVISSAILPRTAMGKIKRHKLAALYDSFTANERLEVSSEQWWQNLSAQDKELMSNSAAKIVMKYLNSRLHVKQLSLDANIQLDLGIDSLEWLEISLDIRDQAGVELDEESIAKIMTLRDLLKAVVRSDQNNSFAIDPFLHWQKCLSEEQKKWLLPLNPFMTATQFCLQKFNRLLMRLLFRLKVEGLENISPNAQYVFIPNHASYLDPFVLAAALPLAQLLNSQWAGWVGIAFANPLARLGSRLARVIPIDAEHALSSSLSLGAGALDNKRNLVWFPEGRRTLSGEIQDFKGGIGLLLNHKPVQVIPVYLENTGLALPPGDWLLRPVQVTVHFGRAHSVDQLKNIGTGETSEKKIMNALHKLVSDLACKSLNQKEKIGDVIEKTL